MLLVSLSVVLGARLLGEGEAATEVWAVDAPLAAGQTVSASQLRPVAVSFASPEDAGRYVSADEPVPEGTVLGRDVAAGELLPVAAISDQGDGLLELPVAVAGGGLPASTAPGDRVDVWSVPLARTTTRAPRADQVLRAVPVLRVGGRGLAGPEASRQVVVGVDPRTDLAPVVAMLSDTSVVLVRRP